MFRDFIIGFSLGIIFLGTFAYKAFKVSAPPLTDASRVKFKVALQPGHYLVGPLPEELKGISQASSINALLFRRKEKRLALDLALRVKEKLELAGVEVDILPVQIPPRYLADAFVAIHFDWNLDPSVRGFKVAPSDFDLSSKSSQLALYLFNSLKEIMKPYNLVTEDMSKYYAFNFKKFKHSLDSRTPAVILEVAFMSSLKEINFVQKNLDKVAEKITEGILKFLTNSSV